jgi:polysaccharide biosynthesis/export protein
MGSITTTILVGKENLSMPALKFSRIACVLVLTASCAWTADAQYAPPPKVGGNGTFDTPPASANANAENARRRLSPITAVPRDFSSLKLAPGFLLSMEVYDTPEYSGDLRIDSNGNVNVPMVGSVHIADLTLTEAAKTIAAALRDSKMLKDPHVNLNVEEYASKEVTVLGEVRTPGPVEVLAPRRLDDVLALAGGETEYAGNTIEIRHQVGTTSRTDVLHYSRKLDNHVLSDTVVQPGDTVTVRRAGIVYVLGAVTRPGGYIMQENGELDVTQAVALAYGTTMPAAISSMRLIRKQDDGKVQEIPLHFRDMEKGKIPPLRLQAEDVIYVPVSKVKATLTSGLLNTAVNAAVVYR